MPDQYFSHLIELNYELNIQRVFDAKVLIVQCHSTRSEMAHLPWFQSEELYLILEQIF